MCRPKDNDTSAKEDMESMFVVGEKPPECSIVRDHETRIWVGQVNPINYYCEGKWNLFRIRERPV